MPSAAWFQVCSNRYLKTTGVFSARQSPLRWACRPTVLWDRVRGTARARSAINDLIKDWRRLVIFRCELIYTRITSRLNHDDACVGDYVTEDAQLIGERTMRMIEKEYEYSRPSRLGCLPCCISTPHPLGTATSPSRCCV